MSFVQHKPALPHTKEVNERYISLFYSVSHEPL